MGSRDGFLNLSRDRSRAPLGREGRLEDLVVHDDGTSGRGEDEVEDEQSLEREVVREPIFFF